MLATGAAAPPPIDPELVEAVRAAQPALKRFLATRKAPAYLRQGVAPLMTLTVPMIASVNNESGRA